MENDNDGVKHQPLGIKRKNMNRKIEISVKCDSKNTFCHVSKYNEKLL